MHYFVVEIRARDGMDTKGRYLGALSYRAGMCLLLVNFRKNTRGRRNLSEQYLLQQQIVPNIPLLSIYGCLFSIWEIGASYVLALRTKSCLC